MKKIISFILSTIIITTTTSTDSATIYISDSFTKDTASVVEIKSVLESDLVTDVYTEEITDTNQKIVEGTEIEYFDVPLEKELQEHIFALCEKYEINPAIVISMIKLESNYTIDIIGDKGNSFGLMQIQPRWHSDRIERLGCTDLLDPYQNVTVGIDILRELIESGKGIEWALMAYNGGPGYANKKAASGLLSDYAKEVLNFSKELVRS